MNMLGSTTRSFGFSLLCSAALALGCADQDPDDAGAEPGDGIGPGTNTGGGDGGTNTGGDDFDDGSDGVFDVGTGGTGDGGGGDEGTDEGCKLVDLLFVVDNSGSMSDEQENVAASVPGFIAGIETELAETMGYNIGVITSDEYNANENGCQELGALVTRTGGQNSSNQTCTPYASGARYMTQDDDLEDTFGCAARVGTSGDGDEKPMEALMNALGGDVGGCNTGFLRDDALLVIILITDEEDDMETDSCGLPPGEGSTGGPQEWYDAVVAAKGGVESNIVVLSLIGPDGNQACSPLDKCQGGITGAEVGTRLLDFTRRFTYGTVGQVCAPDYGPFFTSAISIIDSACGDFEPPV